ncbi:MAG: electron transport complex subunit RsxA [Chitinivibrionia bacterium]|nr:electron transport complex subunit RsxA [Chitinivibrionia bacterium]
MLVVFMQISIGAIFISNFVLSRFLGLCPFFGVSKKLSTALGMGLSVTFVMVGSTLFAYPFNEFILKPMIIDPETQMRIGGGITTNGMEYFQTISFVLIIAAFTQVVEMMLKKFSPMLYESLGVFLPLMATNCAILGVALLNVQVNQFTGEIFQFHGAIVHSFMSGVGFTLAIVLMAGIRERLEFANVPKALEGLPISLIAAGLMAIAFLGFTGMSIGG